MPACEYRYEIENSSFEVGDFMKVFFKSQGITPYLPLKSEIVKNYKQKVYKGNYKLWNYAMPYDIESEHLKQHRDKIRACEKKSVNSVFYDYIFTYPAL